MSVFDYLDKLRQKSEAERRGVAIVWSLVVTLIIVIIWFINSFWILPEREVTNKESFLKPHYERIMSGISIISQSAKNVFQKIKE